MKAYRTRLGRQLIDGRGDERRRGKRASAQLVGVSFYAPYQLVNSRRRRPAFLLRLLTPPSMLATLGSILLSTYHLVEA
jgi:hypothetical protein